MRIYKPLQMRLLSFLFCALPALGLACGTLHAQDKSAPDRVVTISSVYNTGNILYNLQSHSKEVLVLNPTRASFAILSGNGDRITVLSNRNRSEIITRLRSTGHSSAFTAVAYTPDAREIITADGSGKISTYNTDGYSPVTSFQTGHTYNLLAISPNKYYIAAARGNVMDIWDVGMTALKKTLYFAGPINHIVFSPDSKNIAISSDTSGLNIVNALNYSRRSVTRSAVNVLRASFHPDGKYIAYAKEDSVIVYNLPGRKAVHRIRVSSQDRRRTIPAALDFQKIDSIVSLIYISPEKFTFWDMSSLPPLYQELLDDEVDRLMADWIQQMDGESLEDYRVRVTDDNAARQKAMLLDQAATAIASRTIKLDDPFIGETYDTGTRTIDITFTDAGTIQLEIPEEDVAELRTGSLSFANPVYTLDDNDEFKLAYLEVVNEVTGKTYVFDRRNYIIRDVDFGEEETTPDLIPVTMLQTANLEMEALQEETRRIVEEKKQENVITDKTEITISSEIQSDFDASGRQIYNYLLGYRYDVSEGFSYQEDFGPGKFKVEESNAAQTMLEAIKTALEGSMSRYAEEATAIEVTITGTADAIPVGRIPYDGSCGEYNETPYYAKEVLSSMTVTDKSDIRDNEQLAFIRAAGVKLWLEDNVAVLKDNKDKCKYNFRTEVSNIRGGEFRRIIVEVKFRDILEN